LCIPAESTASIFPPNRFVQLVATAPAKLFGLYPRKGTIAVGSDADLVIFDPNHEEVISAKTHHMRVDYSMFEGIRTKGAPKTVFLPRPRRYRFRQIRRPPRRRTIPPPPNLFRNMRSRCRISRNQRLSRVMILDRCPTGGSVRREKCAKPRLLAP